MEYTGQYAQALQSLANQLNQLSGNTDLTNRPRVSPNDMARAGYDIDGYATTYTGTYSNPDETLAMNFTPIQASNGVLQNIYNQDFMQRYAEDVIAGRRADDLGLQIGGSYTGKDAIQKAEVDANKEHTLQELYYALKQQYGI